MKRTSIGWFGVLVGLALCAAGAAAAAQQPAPGAGGPTIDPDTPIELGRFAEPVELIVLAEFIGEVLQINIQVEDPGLAGAQVQIKAPIAVRAGDLLELLDLLLEPFQYAVTRSPEGWYMIRKSTNLPTLFGGDEFSTSVVIPTPGVSPSLLQGLIGGVLAGNQQVKAIYNDEMGVIIATASPRTLRTLQMIVDQILAQLDELELFRFEVESISAADARQRIASLLAQGQAQAAPRQQQPATAASPGGQQGAGGAAALPGGGLVTLAQRLRIDKASNTLILRGSPEEAEEVRQWLGLVDVVSKMTIRRYFAGPLAPEIAGFGSRQGFGPIVQGDAGGESLGSAFIMSATDQEVFAYIGTEAQHERVRALVTDFAAFTDDVRVVVEFYKLENIDVEDAAQLISELLQIDDTRGEGGGAAPAPFLPGSLERGQGPRNQRVGQSGFNVGSLSSQDALRETAVRPDRGTPAGEGEEEQSGLGPADDVLITADEANNQLIVRAPVRRQREIRSIIEKIDMRRPQVFVDVRIVSVSDSDGFTFNVDTALNPGTEAIFQGLSSLAEAAFVGGATSVIIDSDMTPVVISAMASEGRGRILSTPSVLVKDNETASFSSTENEPFSQTSQVTGAPNQTSFGGNTSAGTTISVTPTVSEGGFINLEYSVELSAFGERPSPDLPPSSTSDSISSIVTIPSDSTVVIGGFSLATETESKSKVPFIGDIPLFGLLFQNYTNDTSRRTVYVFITPRVLRDPSFADLRLLTKGPLVEARLESDLPPLEPARMPLVVHFREEEEATADASAPSGEE